MTVFAVDFHSDARIELATIAHRYEELAVDLGVEFLLSIDATLKRIQRYPLLYAATWESFRRAVIPRFPFGLVYQVSCDAVRVIAVYPLRSDPDDIAYLLTTRSS
jgi:toxin ParE1/3/4